MSAGKNPLIGARWAVLINGKRTLNAATIGVKFHGEIEEAEDTHNVYDVARALLDHVESQNADMEFPESLLIKLVPLDVLNRKS